MAGAYFVFLFNSKSYICSINTIDYMPVKWYRDLFFSLKKYNTYYFFDFCKKGTSAFCYFHNKDVANMPSLENGESRRYSLVTNLWQISLACVYTKQFIQ